MDLLEFWVCVLATLFVGIKEGIIIGMAFSLLLAIYRMVQVGCNYCQQKLCHTCARAYLRCTLGYKVETFAVCSLSCSVFFLRNPVRLDRVDEKL